MTLKSISVLVGTACLLSACTGGPKETGGALLGGAGGALIGSQIGGGTGKLVAVAVGTLIGAAAGSAIGRSLDQEDQRTQVEATRQSLQSGQAMQWQSSKNPGVSGVITPLDTHASSAAGSREGNCREYQQTVIIGGRTEKAFGKACRQSNGDWKIVK